MKIINCLKLLIMMLFSVFFICHSLLAKEADCENLWTSDNYTIEQPDKKARDIIMKADRIRWPQEPIKYNVHIIDYRNNEIIAERKLAILMRLFKPTKNIPGDAKVLASFLEPRELSNDRMLAVFDQLWYYTPKARNPVRVTRQQRLIGQVSNGDVVASDFHYSYQSTLVGEGITEGTLCYKLKLERRWEFVTYPRITYWVEKETYRPIKAEFYSSSNRLMKRSFYRDYREALDEIRPHEVLIEDGLTKDSYTRIIYSEAEFGDVPDVYFQPSYLARMR